jgi:hypothetical protein
MAGQKNPETLFTGLLSSFNNEEVRAKGLKRTASVRCSVEGNKKKS